MAHAMLVSVAIAIGIGLPHGSKGSGQCHLHDPSSGCAVASAVASVARKKAA